ncbi:MAG: T9SS type A sorting domain-containing protein [Bacteroidales bacterium]|nr:T9SS type A sorting domain-containing protein [Bacteroidales bacterium]MCB9000271.1 T9SS type A sorting domain-containing protein [Bacteroidales bacterium]MCB9012825.1 T9SS type A sorting domain-containing protein [Bacteroidales bacterium]
MTRKILLFIFVVLLLDSSLYAQQLAFPGADGFGKYTTGGRGGAVIEVTTLADSGPGSLREAISTTGARTIIFKVSGTIYLKSTLKISKPDITIAGQTAPGEGITIANYNFDVNATNVIIRYIRCRLGDVSKQEADAFSCNSSTNVIIDHCSFSWSVDEVASCYSNKNFTMQWCIISESMYNSVHSKGEHGYGGIWGGSRASFHHNLIAHNTSRNPRFNGARYNTYPWDELVDHRNNVIYNWGFNSAYGGEPSDLDGTPAHINMVANYYQAGPATKTGEVQYRVLSPDAMPGYGYSFWHIDSNVVDLHPEVFTDNWLYGVQGVSAADKLVMKSDTSFPYEMANTQTAEEAFLDVTRYAGCNLPRTDTVDKRILWETINKQATYGGATWGAGTGIIDSQNDVGGWPALFQGRAPLDTDHDGMPDEWEIDHGLSISDPSDRNGDENLNGYTNLEDYLNSITEYPYFIYPPTNLNAKLIDLKIVNLSWIDNSIDEDGFYLERKSGTVFERIDTLGSDTNFYTDTVPDFSTSYVYRILAFNASDSSIFSVSNIISTPGENDKPLVAVNPNPANNSKLIDVNTILSWEKGLGAVSHLLYLGKTSNPDFVAELSDTSYIPAELEHGTTYFWRVDEKNSNGITTGTLWTFQTNVIPGDLLVGHWAMESVSRAADSSFFANNGAFTGFYAFSTTVPGAVNKAVLFNGSNQYATIPHHEIFNFNTNSFSIAFWLKQDASTINGPKDFPVLTKGSHIANIAAARSGKRYEIYYDGGTGKMRFEIDDNVKSSYVAADGSGFLTGKWMHGTVVRDSVNKQLRIYLNGQLQNTATDATGDISETEDLYFAFGNDAASYLPGALDDIRMYNYVLADEEIAQLVAMGPDYTSVKTDLYDMDIKVYPNPASEHANLSFRVNKTEKISIELYTISGKKIRGFAGKTFMPGYVNMSLPLENINKGEYILIIRSDEGYKGYPLLVK